MLTYELNKLIAPKEVKANGVEEDTAGRRTGETSDYHKKVPEATNSENAIQPLAVHACLPRRTSHYVQ